jgi:Chaperone of endosialidase
MASTYSSRLRLEQPATGEQATTWGDTTNRNLGALLEQAIAGISSVTMGDADYTLTTANGSVDEARGAVLYVTSSVALTASRAVILPSVQKQYWIGNATSGGQSIIFKTAAGTNTATVPNGYFACILCNGTDVQLLTAPTLGNGAMNLGQPLTATVGTFSDHVTAPTFNGALVGNSTGTHSGPVQVSRTQAAYFGPTSEGNAVYSNGVNGLAFNAGGIYAGYFDGSGNLTVRGNISWASDERLKRDIAPVLSSLQRVRAMSPKTWVREDGGAEQLGIIAQDAERAHPLAVLRDDAGMLSVNVGAVVGLLVGAVRELAERIERMEAKSA